MRLLLTADPSLKEQCSSKVELLQQTSCLEQADCTFDMATAKGEENWLLI